MSSELLLLALLTLGVAALYSSVGHGGASGYLAAMALVGMAPAEMKPAALLLNVCVAGLASWRYIRARQFETRTFLPFALGSIPFAFLGGWISAPDDLYKRLLGAALIVAALRMIWSCAREGETRPVPQALAVFAGAGIGFVSGLIGVGGGIFLSPILILAGWATTRQTTGISALFILVNSIAGLAGHATSLQRLPHELTVLIPIALAGGIVGTELGAKRLDVPALRWLLATVVIVAAGKMLLVA